MKALYVEESSFKFSKRFRFPSSNMGVPQGSILMAIMFILYVNDSTQACSSANWILHIDYTWFILPEKFLQSLNWIVLPTFKQWLNNNLIYLNSGEIHYFRINCRLKNVFELDVRIINQVLRAFSSMKFLGLLSIYQLWKTNVIILTVYLYEIGDCAYSV